MADRRNELRDLLELPYKSYGWKIMAATDGTVRAAGLNGVTWIGLPVLAEDLEDPAFEARLLTLSNERMPRGELCPLELLPDESCANAVRAVLDRLRLRDRGHVEVYSLAA
jgi:hypothetical protein